MRGWFLVLCSVAVPWLGCAEEEKPNDPDSLFDTNPRSDASVSGDAGGGGSSSGSTPDAQAPTRLHIRQLSASITHTCALWSDGKLQCWGNNVAGQLGYGDIRSRGSANGEMGADLPFVDVGIGRQVSKVSAGVSFTCALLDNGRVKCWGDNEYGQLGNGAGDVPVGDTAGQMGDALPYVDLGTGVVVKDLSTGSYSSCALLDNDSVKCWGDNLFGVLGYGDQDNRGDGPNEMGDALPPVDFAGSGVERVHVAKPLAGQHSCAILKTGALKCWGGNAYGQLGLGDNDNRGDEAAEMGTALGTVVTGENVADLALGDGTTCAVLDTGRLRCWGRNGQGQLGVGDLVNRGASERPQLPLINLGTNRKIASIDANSHTCVALEDGTVKCWGLNYSGQLGYGDTSNRGASMAEMSTNLPTVDVGGEVRLIAVGGSHTCVVLGDKQVKCWGDNGSGRLGYGDEQNRGETAGSMGANLPDVSLGR